jgi:hypothetical protein
LVFSKAGLRRPAFFYPRWNADGLKITEGITPAGRLAKTFHTPFRSNEFNFRKVMRWALEFFVKDEKLNNEVSSILFLFREAPDDESVHGGANIGIGIKV